MECGKGSIHELTNSDITGIDTRFLAWGGEIIMLKCQTCIRYVIVLAILHILIGIGLINKLQEGHIELSIASYPGSLIIAGRKREPGFNRYEAIIELQLAG